MVANREHHNPRRVQVPDDCHIAEDIRVARVVELYAIRKLQYIATSFATVDDLIAVLNAAGMDRMHHGDVDAGNGLGSALVHGRNPLDSLFLKPQAQLKDSYRYWIKLPANRDCIAYMIAMTVSAQQNVRFLDLFLALRTFRISRDPRVQIQSLPFRCFNPKSSMPKPRQPNSFKVQNCSFNRRKNNNSIERGNGVQSSS